MLLKLLDFSFKNADFIPLELVVLGHLLQIFVQNFIFVPLLFDIRLELLVVFPCLHVQFVLDDLRFLDKDIHHHVNFLPNLVSVLFEKLEQIVALHKSVFKCLYLLID